MIIFYINLYIILLNFNFLLPPDILQLSLLYFLSPPVTSLSVCCRWHWNRSAAVPSLRQPHRRGGPCGRPRRVRTGSRQRGSLHHGVWGVAAERRRDSGRFLPPNVQVVNLKKKMFVISVPSFFPQVLFNVFDAFVSLGGPKINAAEIIKGIGKTPISKTYKPINEKIS